MKHVEEHKRRMHTKKERNKERLSCDLCDKTFGRKDALQMHRDNIHFKKTFDCDKCGKSFGHKNSLKVHMENVHLGIKYECDLCQKKFPSMRHLGVHKRGVHQGKLIKCDLCENTYNGEKALKDHIARIHERKEGTNFPCDLCDKTYTLKENLGRHKRYVHGSTPKTWNCDICGIVYKCQSGLKRHNETKHLEVERLKCDLCEKTYSCKSSLRLHTNLVHGSSAKHTTHKKQIHESNGEKTEECEQCGAKFSSKRYLKFHIRHIHTLAKKPCPVCKKEYGQISMYSHIAQVHGDHEELVCDICDKTFKGTFRLNDHKKTRWLYPLDFEQNLAQTYFFDFWVLEGMLIPPRGVRSQSHEEKLQLLNFLDFRDFRLFSTIVNQLWSNSTTILHPHTTFKHYKYHLHIFLDIFKQETKEFYKQKLHQ